MICMSIDRDIKSGLVNTTSNHQPTPPPIKTNKHTRTHKQTHTHIYARTLEGVDGHVVPLGVELLGPHQRVRLPLEVRHDEVHELEDGLQTWGEGRGWGCSSREPRREGLGGGWVGSEEGGWGEGHREARKNAKTHLTPPPPSPPPQRPPCPAAPGSRPPRQRTRPRRRPPPRPWSGR